ncbi:hypothetical protein D3C74_495820 [compost metagenome]
MIHRQADVFIEIIGRGFGEADQALVIHFHQSGIDANRRTAGGQTEHGLWVALKQTGNQIGTGLYEILITVEL